MFETLFPDQPDFKPNDPTIFQQPTQGYIPPDQIEIQSPYYNNTPKPVTLLPHQEAMWDTLDEFEEMAWSDANTGVKTGWADFDNALDGGFKSGWVIVGGASNVGKTSFLSLMGWNIAHANPDVFVMDFSLDDPMKDKIPRVVAGANKVLINAVRMPKSFEHLPDMLKRRSHGLDAVRNAVDKYQAYDANHGTDIDEIDRTVQKMMVSLEEEAARTGKPRRKLIVMIDNFHDLTTTAREAMGSDKSKYDYLAQRCSDMATLYDIVLISTGEFKKLNGFRRPSTEDLRESIKIVYEAKLILLCHNEVGTKGESAAIYYEKQGANAKQPVFEVSFGKNKMSSFKGRLFYEFYPEIAYFMEADKAAASKYRNLVYSNN